MEESEKDVTLTELSPDLPESELTEMISITMICRLCANQSDKLISIFGEDGLSNDLPNKMNLYLPIKVSETDELPLQCCWQCASTVLAWHELVVTSVEADRRFKSYEFISHKQLEGIQYDDVDDNVSDINEYEVEQVEKDTDGILESSTFTSPSCNTSLSNSPQKNIVRVARNLQKISKKPDLTNQDLSVLPKKDNSFSSAKSENDSTIAKLGGSFNVASEPFSQELAYTFACVLCPTLFLTQEDVAAHIEADHTSQEQQTEIQKSRVDQIVQMDQNEMISQRLPQDLLANNSELVEELLNSSKVLNSDGKTLFCCKECGQYFQYKYALLWHLAAHSGEKPLVFSLQVDDEASEKSDIHSDEPSVIYEIETSEQEQDVSESFNTETPTTTELSPVKIKSGDNSKFANLKKDNKELRVKLPDFIKINKRPLEIKDNVEENCSKKPKLEESPLNIEEKEAEEGDVTILKQFDEVLTIPDNDNDVENSNELKNEDDPQTVDNQSSSLMYQCPLCSKTYDLLLKLNEHLVEEHDVDKDDLPVEEKSSKPRRKHNKIDQALVNKAKILIDDKVYYNCKDCGKSLHSPYTYVWHIRIHTGERPFVCDLCGKQFRVSQGLTRHLKETHEKIKTFPCDLCGRMFGTRRNVEEHRRIHTNERPYVCALCGKSFKQKASLFVHNRSHSNSFPFKCTYCPQVFRTKPPLTVHMTRHTGEKPYNCDVCGRAFRINYELKRHKLIHSENKPHSCEICGARFRQKRYLKNHNRAHKEDDEEEEAILGI